MKGSGGSLRDSFGPGAADDGGVRTAARWAGEVLAIQDARIRPSPDVPPIEHGTVLIRDGRIAEVGTSVDLPPNAHIISAEGGVVTAGFWNAHVHFTEAKWRHVEGAPPELLEGQLRDMFTGRGFTTVVDTGSDPRVTLRLRRRIESEGLPGPTVYTAGPSVFPPRGIPYYLRGTLPWWLRPFVPTPSTPGSARRVTERNLARGADLMKLFTGSYIARGTIRTMPEPIARAAVGAAHAHGRLVFSHPSNLEGTRIAIRAGVDVLAHPPDTAEGVDEGVVREMVDRRMAMTPTLKMFARTVSEDPRYLEPIHQVVRQFHALGGQLLFGTDVGYMSDYAVEEEFRALRDCGLTARELLRMLTTAPAERFGVAGTVGKVVAGARADLVLLDADPFDDPLAFTHVRATVRAGRVLTLRQ